MVILDMTKGLNHIGRLGENEYRTFRFPDSCEVLAMYPEATVSVLVKRPGDSVAYPVAPGFVEIRNGAVYWTVQSADLARIGRGNVELTFVDGTTVAKNIIYDVYVDKALDGAGDPPEPWESWRTDITRIAGEIAQDRSATEQAAEDAAEAQRGAEVAQDAAESAARDAAGSAGNAASSARAAEQSVTDAGLAQDGAEEAQRQAEAAQGKAEDAQSGAEEAQGKAETAKRDAEEAAEAAATSERNAAGSVTDAAAQVELAKKYVDGKGTDGTVDPAYSENNANYYLTLTRQAKRDAEDTVNGAKQEIDDEGAAQVQAVEDKGAEVLDSIPADYTELSGDVGNLKSAFSGYAKIGNSDDKYNLLEHGNIFPVSAYQWHYGSIGSGTGADNGDSPRRLRSDYCQVQPNTKYRMLGTGYFIIHFYTSAKVWISMLSVDWNRPECIFTTPATAGYVRFLLKKDSSGNEEFDSESVANLDMACYPVDNALDRVIDVRNKCRVDLEYGLLSRGNIFPISVSSWEYGSFNTSTGEPSGESKTRIRSDFCPVESRALYHTTGNGYYHALFYDNSKAFISIDNPDYQNVGVSFITPNTAKYVRFLLKRDDGDSVIEYDLDAIRSLDMVCYPDDNNLDKILGTVKNEDRNLGTFGKYNLLDRGNVFPYSAFKWNYGSIGSGTGTNSGISYRRIRSDYCPIEPNTSYKFVGSCYAMIYMYDSSKAYLTESTWLTNGNTIITHASASYIRILLKKDSAGTSNFDADAIEHLDAALYPVENELDSLLSDISEIGTRVKTLEDGDLLNLFANKADNTSRGVTWTWDSEKKYVNANGTSIDTDDSNPARNTIYNSTIPTFLERDALLAVHVETESNDLKILLAFSNSGTNVATYIFNTNGIHYIYCPVNATNLTVRFQVTAQATVNNKKIRATIERVKRTEAIVHIPCCTYNVGKYNYGLTPSSENPVQATSKTISEMKEYFRTHQMDIFALQEGPDYIKDSDLTTLTNANEAIYNYLFPYTRTSSTQSRPDSPSLYSKFSFVVSGTGMMTGDRPYVWAILNIHGIPVYVLSVHLALSVSNREADYDDIAALVAPYKYWIVLGDFNAGNNVEGWDAQPEYTALINRGWHTLNGGYWGCFNTHALDNPSGILRAMDTVVTPANIGIDSYIIDAASVYSILPSDHRPVFCNLVLYP